jgi:hypothetical protein
MYDFKELADADTGNNSSVSRQKLSKINLGKKKHFSSSSDLQQLPLIAVKVSLSPRKTANNFIFSEDRKETPVVSRTTRLPAVGNAPINSIKLKSKKQKLRPPTRTYKYKVCILIYTMESI